VSIFRTSRARFVIAIEPNNKFTVTAFEVESLGPDKVISMLRASVFWSMYLDNAFKRWVEEDLGIDFTAKYYQSGKELV
jgi:hypothetical protein